MFHLLGHALYGNRPEPTFQRFGDELTLRQHRISDVAVGDRVIDGFALHALRTGIDPLSPIYRRQLRTLRVRQAAVPFLTQGVQCQEFALVLPCLRPKSIQTLRIGDALFFGDLLDDCRPAGEPPQYVGRESLQLEIVAFAVNPEAQVLEPVR